MNRCNQRALEREKKKSLTVNSVFFYANMCRRCCWSVEPPVGVNYLVPVHGAPLSLPGRGAKKPRQGLSVFLGGVLLADLTRPPPPRSLSATTSLQHTLGSRRGPLTIKSSSLITSEPPGHHPMNKACYLLLLPVCLLDYRGGGQARDSINLNVSQPAYLTSSSVSEPL